MAEEHLERADLTPDRLAARIDRMERELRRQAEDKDSIIARNDELLADMRRKMQPLRALAAAQGIPANDPDDEA